MPTLIRSLVIIGALLAPAAAAEYEAHVYFGASYPVGEIEDYATTGYNFGIGGVASGGTLGLRWDIGFDFRDAQEGAFDSRIVDDGSINSTYFRIGPQLNFGGEDTSFYLNAMAGYYWTYAYISQYATVPGIICDPFWGWCWTVPVAGEYILADRNQEDWGLSATVGVEFETIGGSWFIEMQYHYAQQGEGYQFVPVVVGIRW